MPGGFQVLQIPALLLQARPDGFIVCGRHYQNNRFTLSQTRVSKQANGFGYLSFIGVGIYDVARHGEDY
jgi:hypothetical protein